MEHKRFVTARELAQELGIEPRKIAKQLTDMQCVSRPGRLVRWHREQALALLGEHRARQEMAEKRRLRGRGVAVESLGDAWQGSERERAPGAFPGSISDFKRVAAEFRASAENFWG